MIVFETLSVYPGRPRGGSGWRATFDWIMDEDNWNRILEGSYDNLRPAEEQERDDGMYHSGFSPDDLEEALAIAWECGFTDI